MILSDTFESSSSSATYKAQYDTETGKGTCTCPGWTKRAVRECKHTKDLKASAEECQTPDTCGVSHIDQKPVVHRELQSDDPFQGFREPPAVKPMLASAMKEGQSLEDFLSDEWVMEEKFDGHRLLLVVTKDTVTGWSRPGHDRPAAQRPLPAALEQELAQLPPGLYDGELHIPGGTSSDVVRLDLQDDLALVLFDAISIHGQSIAHLGLDERRALLAVAFQHLGEHNIRVWLAPQTAASVAGLARIWHRGGEGAILKRRASTYKSGWRTPDWIKVKQIDAAEFTIFGFDEGKNGPYSIFKLRHDDGRETSCKILTNDLLRAVAKGHLKYIGRRVVVSHMGFTKSGLWRHPVFDHFVQEG